MDSTQASTMSTSMSDRALKPQVSDVEERLYEELCIGKLVIKGYKDDIAKAPVSCFINLTTGKLHIIKGNNPAAADMGQGCVDGMHSDGLQEEENAVSPSADDQQSQCDKTIEVNENSFSLWKSDGFQEQFHGFVHDALNKADGMSFRSVAFPVALSVGYDGAELGILHYQALKRFSQINACISEIHYVLSKAQSTEYFYEFFEALGKSYRMDLSDGETTRTSDAEDESRDELPSSQLGIPNLKRQRSNANEDEKDVCLLTPTKIGRSRRESEDNEEETLQDMPTKSDIQKENVETEITEQKDPSESNDIGREANTGYDSACPICLIDPMLEPVRISCGHMFCSPCITWHGKQCTKFCPKCRQPYGDDWGDQPTDGTMTVQRVAQSLPGHEDCGMIEITYNFPDGIQGREHPDPGFSYPGTCRIAFLPDNEQGNRVLALFQKAFDLRLTFTIGTSMTTGESGVIVWTDIPHKTSITGGPVQFGYPDEFYLSCLEADLKDKGL